MEIKQSMDTQSKWLKELKIEWVPTDELVPYERNANIHSDEQIDQIASSIREFGFNDPVAVWTNDDGQPELVAGHGRVAAAKKLGIETLPVIHLDALTDEQRRAYTHVHNQQTRNSEFDWNVLDMEMAELDFDWGELGFNAYGMDVDSWFEADGEKGKPKEDGTEQKSICPKCGYEF